MSSTGGCAKESIAAFACRKGKYFQACARNAILYGSEIWAVREEDLAKLKRNDIIVQWMCEKFIGHLPGDGKQRKLYTKW